MLGKKVVQRYFRGDDYLEIDVHVGSSVIASNIVGICRGYAKQLINDCGIVLQGMQAIYKHRKHITIVNPSTHTESSHVSTLSSYPVIINHSYFFFFYLSPLISSFYLS